MMKVTHMISMQPGGAASSGSGVASQSGIQVISSTYLLDRFQKIEQVPIYDYAVIFAFGPPITL
jgi:hypothetical protein